MYRCSKCKEEYHRKIEACLDCGAELEEDTGIEEDDIIEKDDSVVKDEAIEYDTEKLLINVANEVEASMIESILKDCNIPVLKKHKGAGEYLNIYMGTSFCGVDLYVPSKLYESAKAIIKEIQPEELLEPEEELLEPDEEMVLERAAYYRKRSIKTWFTILILVPGVLMILAIIARVFIDYK